jgi:cellulose synthase/poly-beta-1,6-N-acetylglucosamine synthase-like glycosyltransferase
LGAYSIGGATLIGSNALIRRTALDSIGGYQPGLAEDLATSIALHAAGWASAYVAEPLAPGLAPPSFRAWFIQQLKWARGVFELLITAYPRLFKRLTWGQRLSYAVRMTKYWIGPVIGLHLFATIAVLISGSPLVRMAFHQYLIHLAPLALFDLLIRHLSLLYWRHSSTPKTSLIHAIVLVYATWPVYMLAWFMALFRLPLAFRRTPKSFTRGLNPLWLLPQAMVIFLLALGGLYTVIVKDHEPSLLLMFAVLQGFLQFWLFTKWLQSEVIGTIRRPVIPDKSVEEE